MRICENRQQQTPLSIAPPKGKRNRGRLVLKGKVKVPNGENNRRLGGRVIRSGSAVIAPLVEHRQHRQV